jgi:tetratricopeptide (TPR) repeat protein/TolB-like protein
MSSIIEGYNYDIFISYRQKDNKGDKWVSEFVKALKTELESTFKEEISVYFDINPHDGLLETHDVDASLKEKLKCLVFIPIISRTYCDPKSFAWEHEFKSFIEQTSQDQFGLKVKLPNGNVANRVLPVRIHDLDSADIKLCESILGGILRGVEFIYKELGVNRSLSPKDHEEKNLNNTNYRNQINKVALAIKEIILGLKREQILEVKEKAQHKKFFEEVVKEEKKIEKEKPAKLNKRRLIPRVAILAILIIAAVLFYPKIFKRDTLDKLRSSGERIIVTVMPFQNMTNDTIWNVWRDVIQTNITTFLSNYPEELKVSQTELVNNILQSKGLADYYSITSFVASSVSSKLDADVFINGSINQSGSIIRLNAQLVDSKTEEPLKSFQINGLVENIITLIDSLSIMVKDFLIISKLGKEFPPEIIRLWSVNSPEAFRYFKSGQNAFNDRDWGAAANFYSQAIAIDSNFTFATLMLSYAFLNQEMYDQAKKWCLKVYERKDNMAIQQKLMVNWLYASCFESPYEEIKYLRQLLAIDEQAPNYHFLLGLAYRESNQYDKAITEYENSLAIYNRLGVKPQYTGNYSHLLSLYNITGQYKKEKELYKKAEIDRPDNSDLMDAQAVLLLSERDSIAANRYIDKYIAICKEQSVPEANILTRIAGIYSNANIPDKAEEYYRKVLSLPPFDGQQARKNDLAYFLIDKDRNVNEGLGLVDKALELSPDNYNYLHTKGWGLYKQGKYKEALEILQKSWDLRMQNAIYDHSAFLHLEAAKKAVYGQK